MNEAIELFQKGGLVMYALLMASILTVSIFIERFLYFKQADSGSKFANDISAAFQENDFNRATELCNTTKGMNAKILSNILQQKGLSPEYIEKYLEGQANINVAKLRQRVPYLGIVVTMAPLLGLLGTVVGMISSFNVFAAETGQPHAITGGVAEALIATASGLCVAVIALIAHSYFAQRIDTFLTDMEIAFSSYVEALYRRNS